MVVYSNPNNLISWEILLDFSAYFFVCLYMTFWMKSYPIKSNLLVNYHAKMLEKNVVRTAEPEMKKYRNIDTPQRSNLHLNTGGYICESNVSITLIEKLTDHFQHRLAFLTQRLPDLVQLVHVWLARPQRDPWQQLSKHAADGPDVHRRAVLGVSH